jgi:hypothetical protein
MLCSQVLHNIIIKELVSIYSHFVSFLLGSKKIKISGFKEPRFIIIQIEFTNLISAYIFCITMEFFITYLDRGKPR